MVDNSTDNNNHLSSLLIINIKTKTGEAGNPGPGFGQAHNYVEVTPIRAILSVARLEVRGKQS